MTKESREFEEIASAIKQALEPRPDIKIVPHARVNDTVTGRMRDIDILLEATVAGTTLRIGVECRRKKRRVDKPQIEAFVTKLKDCRIDKGVFVSSSGFAKEALTAAKHHNLVCCHLTKVNELPWIQVFFCRVRQITNVRFHGDVQLTTAGILAGIPSMVEFPDGTIPPMPWADIGMHIVGLQEAEVGHHRRRIVYEPSSRPIAMVSGHPPVLIARIELDAEFDIIEIEPTIDHWLYAREGQAPQAGMTKVYLCDIDGVPLTLEVIATADATLSSPKPGT